MRRTAMIGVMIVAAVAGSLVPAAAGSSRPPARPGPVPGLVVTESTRGFADTVDALIAAIGGSPASVVTVVDHAAAAAAVGRTLEPTTVVYFGNPVLGTPLMQADPMAGIDLPQKFLVQKAADGTVTITWNDPDLIALRHRTFGARDTLATIAGALEVLATTAADAG